MGRCMAHSRGRPPPPHSREIRPRRAGWPLRITRLNELSPPSLFRRELFQQSTHDAFHARGRSRRIESADEELADVAHVIAHLRNLLLLRPIRSVRRRGKAAARGKATAASRRQWPQYRRRRPYERPPSPPSVSCARSEKREREREREGESGEVVANWILILARRRRSRCDTLCL